MEFEKYTSHTVRLIVTTMFVMFGISACGGGGDNDIGTGANMAGSGEGGSVSSDSDCIVTDEDTNTPSNPINVSYSTYGADGVTLTLTSNARYVTTRNAAFGGYSGLIEVNGPESFTSYVNGVAGEKFSDYLRDYISISETSTLEYGYVNESGSATVTTMYDPPISRPRKPTLNVPYSYTVVETTTGSHDHDRSPSQTVTETETWIGVESITIPAGTFSACRILVDRKVTAGSDAGFSSRITQWNVANGPFKGLLVKYVGEGFESSGKSLGVTSSVVTAVKFDN